MEKIKRKILIIEDNEQNMYMLTYLLEVNNFDVLQAYSGKEGIELAEKHNPYTILLDIQLPVMDGYTVAAELRKISSLSATPIVVVTSYAMPGDKEKAITSGAIGYIEKPIDPFTFMSQLESFIKTAKGV